MAQIFGFLSIFRLPFQGESGKCTRVGNALSEPIFVKVDSEICHTTKFDFNANLGANGVFTAGGGMAKDQVLSEFIKVGFAKVQPNDYLKVSPEVRTGGRVYITVWCSSQGYLWDNQSQLENVDFMVRENGGIKEWKDESYGPIKRSQPK